LRGRATVWWCSITFLFLFNLSLNFPKFHLIHVYTRLKVTLSQLILDPCVKDNFKRKFLTATVGKPTANLRAGFSGVNVSRLGQCVEWRLSPNHLSYFLGIFAHLAMGRSRRVFFFFSFFSVWDPAEVVNTCHFWPKLGPPCVFFTRGNVRCGLRVT